MKPDRAENQALKPEAAGEVETAMTMPGVASQVRLEGESSTRASEGPAGCVDGAEKGKQTREREACS